MVVEHGRLVNVIFLAVGETICRVNRSLFLVEAPEFSISSGDCHRNCWVSLPRRMVEVILRSSKCANHQRQFSSQVSGNNAEYLDRDTIMVTNQIMAIDYSL